ncbi:MAG: hypothetical protein MI754_18625 [Chromatiales bacterium]|nr:hypothetical protein [Chromatiales bacterium]
MNNQIPPSLFEAIQTEPLWLQAWVMLLGLSLIASVFFVVGRSEGGWKLRPECLAILASLFVAGAIMEWLYAQVGYVRLLGLGHLIGWTPVYAYVLWRRKKIGTDTWFGKYIHVYLIVAGISLLIDAVDVIRYLAGDGELYLRWA